MKNIIVVVLIIALAGVSYFGYTTFNPKPMPKPSPANEMTQELPDPSTATTSFNLDQIAQHASKESCWMAIEGKVYDMTPFVASGFHPGKDAILEGCGIDATELFNTRPMGSKTPHSEKSRTNLPKYYIGELVQS